MPNTRSDSVTCKPVAKYAVSACDCASAPITHARSRFGSASARASLVPCIEAVQPGSATDCSAVQQHTDPPVLHSWSAAAPPQGYSWRCAHGRCGLLLQRRLWSISPRYDNPAFAGHILRQTYIYKHACSLAVSPPPQRPPPAIMCLSIECGCPFRHALPSVTDRPRPSQDDHLTAHRALLTIADNKEQVARVLMDCEKLRHRCGHESLR